MANFPYWEGIEGGIIIIKKFTMNLVMIYLFQQQ
mgnify:CR=1 FL=1